MIKVSEMVQVSRLCFGQALIGAKNSEYDAWKMLDIFHDFGGNFIDTARCYSDWLGLEKGRSERILGDYFKSCRNRKDWIVCSKCCHPLIAAPSATEADRKDAMRNRVSPESILSDLEQSLNHLQSEQVDLYLLHRDNTAVPVSELMQAFEEARLAGKINAYGVSNWSVGRMREALNYCRSKGYAGIRCNQIHYNPALRNLAAWPDPGMCSWNDDFERFHAETRMPVMGYSALAGGFFDKAAAGDPDCASSPYFSEENLRLAKHLSEEARKKKTIIPALLLKSASSVREFPVIPVFSAYRESQLVEILTEFQRHMK